MISARKIQEPIAGLITHVFLPIQPMPGVLRVDALLDGTRVDVGPRLERLAVHLAHPGDERIETGRQDPVVIVAPGVARNESAYRGSSRSIGVRPVGVVEGAGDDDRASRRQDAPHVLRGARRCAACSPCGPRSRAPATRERNCNSGKRRSGRDAAQIEAQFPRPRLDAPPRVSNCRQTPGMPYFDQLPQHVREDAAGRKPTVPRACRCARVP